MLAPYLNVRNIKMDKKQCDLCKAQTAEPKGMTLLLCKSCKEKQEKILCKYILEEEREKNGYK